jgi:hypothetical protein
MVMIISPPLAAMLLKRVTPALCPKYAFSHSFSHSGDHVAIMSHASVAQNEQAGRQTNVAWRPRVCSVEQHSSSI